MPDNDAAREYAEAKAQYLVALQRLKAAKAALPPKPHRTTYEEAEQRSAAIWQRYLEGQQDMRALAAEFGLSRSFTTAAVAYQRRRQEWKDAEEDAEDYARAHGVTITGRSGLGY